MHKLFLFCRNFYILTKKAEEDFDPFFAGITAKQSASEVDIPKIDNILALYGQLAQATIEDPHDREKLQRDAFNIQSLYEGLIRNTQSISNVTEEISYFVENTQAEVNNIIVRLRNQIEFGAEEETHDPEIESEFSYEYDQGGGEERDESFTGAWLGEERGETGEAALEEDFNPFAEFEEDMEAKQETGLNIRRDRRRDLNRAYWHRLFNKPVATNKDLWKEVLQNTEARFGETTSHDARQSAWNEYKNQGGKWQLYKDIHAERERKHYHNKIKPDPEKYRKHLEKNLKEYHSLSDENAKKRNKMRAKRHREQALQNRLKKLKNFMR